VRRKRIKVTPGLLVTQIPGALMRQVGVSKPNEGPTGFTALIFSLFS
jgi:hypothetical protein